MKSLSVLILGSAIMMMVVVGGKPKVYLVETEDGDAELEKMIEEELEGYERIEERRIRVCSLFMSAHV